MSTSSKQTPHFSHYDLNDRCTCCALTDCNNPQDGQNGNTHTLDHQICKQCNLVQKQNRCPTYGTISSQYHWRDTTGHSAVAPRHHPQTDMNWHRWQSIQHYFNNCPKNSGWEAATITKDLQPLPVRYIPSPSNQMTIRRPLHVKKCT